MPYKSRIFVIAYTAMLAGCATEPKIVVSTVIPDLPRPDAKLMERTVNPKCVKSKAKDISVRETVAERDCFKAHSIAVADRFHALQDSVTETNAAIDKLKASKPGETGKSEAAPVTVAAK